MAEDAKLLCVQFGYRDIESGIIVAKVIPLWHRTNNMYNPDEAWKLITPFYLELPATYTTFAPNSINHATNKNKHSC